jgi:hypothetical protein
MFPAVYEYHTVSLSRPIPREQRAELEACGWTLFSEYGPVAPGDVQHTCHFRRPLEPHRRPARRRA